MKSLFPACRKNAIFAVKRFFDLKVLYASSL